MLFMILWISTQLERQAAHVLGVIVVYSIYCQLHFIFSFKHGVPHRVDLYVCGRKYFYFVFMLQRKKYCNNGVCTEWCEKWLCSITRVILRTPEPIIMYSFKHLWAHKLILTHDTKEHKHWSCCILVDTHGLTLSWKRLVICDERWNSFSNCVLKWNSDFVIIDSLTAITFWPFGWNLII